MNISLGLALLKGFLFLFLKFFFSAEKKTWIKRLCNCLIEIVLDTGLLIIIENVQKSLSWGFIFSKNWKLFFRRNSLKKNK